MGDELPLISGKQGYAKERKDDLRRSGFRWGVGALDHVEGHAAAWMRKARARRASLVLNNPPCEGEYGCRSQLPAILPKDAVLEVYVKNKDGSTTLFDRYTGTGEGLNEQ